MRIKPIGAAGGEVTGSAYLVETKKARLLVDCGLFQGGEKSEALNRAPVRRDVTLDAVLLTHGHLDHTGRLPLLARLGYRGPVFATPATIDMTGLIVRDATRIQAQDVERVNRRLLRLGGEPLEPLYVGEDTEQIVSQLKPVPYRTGCRWPKALRRDGWRPGICWDRPAFRSLSKRMAERSG